MQRTECKVFLFCHILIIAEFSRQIFEK